MKLKNEQPSYWKTASLSYSPEYIKNISVLPSPEPPWKNESIGLNRDREYFFGEQYVLINERFDYELSNDGLCRLIKTKEERRTIDDGKIIIKSVRKTNPRIINPKQPYDDPWMNNVPFNKSRIKQNISPVITSAKANKELSALSKNQDLSEKLAALKLLNQQQSTPATEKKITDKQSLAESMTAIKKAFSLSVENANKPKQANTKPDNFAAGQRCDWVKPDTLSSKVCYWSRSHTYPSSLRRPIILKKSYKDTNEQARLFRFIEAMPTKVMQTPQ